MMPASVAENHLVDVRLDQHLTVLGGVQMGFYCSLAVTAQAWGPIAVRWGGRPSGGGRIKWAKPIRPRVRRRSRRTRTTTKPVGQGRGGDAPEQIPLAKEYSLAKEHTMAKECPCRAGGRQK